MEEIGKILPKILKPELSRLEPPVVEVLAPLWTHVAGKTLAKECHPVAFSAGTLTLATQDAAWAEPLRQMVEEIRARVNDFLGKPVVKHLKILRVRKLQRGDQPPWQSEELLASEPPRGDWLRPGSGMASDVAQAIGRSRAKYFARKRGKAH